MRKQFTSKVTAFLVKENIVKEEKLVVYQFGVERLLKNLLVLLIISVIMISSNTGVGTIFFFIGFIPIRRIAGGYHAESSTKCNIISIITYGLNISFIYNMYESVTYQMLCLLIFISITLIFRFAPVDHKNFIFDFDRTMEARKKSRRVIILLSILSYLFILILKGLNIISLSITMGTLTASVSILIGSIKRRRERDELNSINK